MSDLLNENIKEAIAKQTLVMAYCDFGTLTGFIAAVDDLYNTEFPYIEMVYLDYVSNSPAGEFHKALQDEAIELSEVDINLEPDDPLLERPDRCFTKRLFPFQDIKFVDFDVEHSLDFSSAAHVRTFKDILMLKNSLKEKPATKRGSKKNSNEQSPTKNQVRKNP